MGATRYSIYGLLIETRLPLSCDRLDRTASAGTFRLPHNPRTDDQPDVRLYAGSRARFEQVRRRFRLASKPADWFECRRLEDGVAYLRWSDLFEFLVAADGRTIEYRPLRRATTESLTTYLLGQVLSFSLLSFGCDPLHATAVVIDGEAVAFLGDCGYGKSTLGAAFVARGYPVLTDDVLALQAQNGGWIAYPGPRRLKLFPSVARKVLARTGGRLLNPGTSKLVLPLAPGEAVNQAVPVRALYVLCDPTSRVGSAPARVRIAPLVGPKAFFEVTRSAFNLIHVDRSRLENHFTMAARLVSEVPVRRLAYPRRLDSIGAVCDAVLNDLARKTPGVFSRSTFVSS